MIEGKVDTIEEMVEVLQDNGFICTVREDYIYLAIKTLIKSYMAEAHLTEDGMLIINCAMGAFKDFMSSQPVEECESNLMAMMLKMNTIINPCAFALIENMDCEQASADESALHNWMIILTDKIPTKDMDPSELLSAINSLVDAIAIFETNLLPAFFEMPEVEMDDDEGDDFDLDDFECDVIDLAEVVEDAALLMLVDELEPVEEEYVEEVVEEIPVSEPVTSTPEPAYEAPVSAPTPEPETPSPSYGGGSSYDSGGSCGGDCGGCGE